MNKLTIQNKKETRTMTRLLVNTGKLQREIDRMLDGFGCAFPHTGEQCPSANLGQDNEHYFVEMLLPGVAPNALEVTVEEGVLRITGKREDAVKRDEKVVWHVSERHTGEFTQRLRLPKDSDTQAVAASYSDGVLVVTVPKLPKTEPKKIEINVSA